MTVHGPVPEHPVTGVSSLFFHPTNSSSSPALADSVTGVSMSYVTQSLPPLLQLSEASTSPRSTVLVPPAGRSTTTVKSFRATYWAVTLFAELSVTSQVVLAAEQLLPSLSHPLKR